MIGATLKELRRGVQSGNSANQPTRSEFQKPLQQQTLWILDCMLPRLMMLPKRDAHFLCQGHVVMERPTVEFLWDLFDAIHHRG